MSVNPSPTVFSHKQIDKCYLPHALPHVYDLVYCKIYGHSYLTFHICPLAQNSVYFHVEQNVMPNISLSCLAHVFCKIVLFLQLLADHLFEYHTFTLE